MKILALLMVGFLGLAGCATVERSVTIDTDQLEGYAAGHYKDSRYGQVGEWGFWVLGGYNADDSASGARPLWFWPWGASMSKREPDPRNFATAIAKINYSKKIKSIKYDESGGIIEYEFEHKPLVSKSEYQPTKRQPNLPSSFGRQPIE